MNRARVSRRPKHAGPPSPGTRTGPVTSTGVPSTTHAAVRLSEPGDASERAADRLADAAIHDAAPQRAITTQAMEGTGGEPLPGQVRSRLESGFGADLGGVRIHTGQDAAEAARSVSARAVTVAGDIAFGAGEYQPGTARGEELIAHEVAHTLQPPEPGVIHRQPTGGGVTPAPLADPLRLSYSDFVRLEDRRRAPLRRWLDTNTDRLRLLSKCALTSRVRDAVPEASGFADVEIHSVLDEWAAAHGFTIPRLSAVPESCDRIGPARGGPSVVDTLANSDLIRIAQRAVSLATDGVDVARDDHGRFNLSARGARVELTQGVFRTAGILGFTGNFSFEADAGLFHFRASLGSERWEMSLGFGTELPARLNAHLERVFVEADASLRRILASAGTLEPSAVKSAVQQEMQRVIDAVDALSRAAALAGPRVSIGIGAVGPGPGLPGPSTPPGTAVEVTLTVWF